MRIFKMPHKVVSTKYTWFILFFEILLLVSALSLKHCGFCIKELKYLGTNL